MRDGYFSPDIEVAQNIVSDVLDEVGDPCDVAVGHGLASSASSHSTGWCRRAPSAHSLGVSPSTGGVPTALPARVRCALRSAPKGSSIDICPTFTPPPLSVDRRSCTPFLA